MENKELVLEEANVTEVEALTATPDVMEGVCQEPQTEALDEDVPDVCPAPQDDVKVFAKADFMMECSCGHKMMVAEGISGGMQYIIPATDKHSLDIQCPGCLTKIKFFFEENLTPNVEPTTDDEQVPQTDQEEESV